MAHESSSAPAAPSASSISSLDVSRRGIEDLASWLDSPLLAAAPLTHLDASRNNIRTCDGLDRLCNLRSLSLYYNKISRASSLIPLRALSATLRSLDLRLNPLCNRGAEYRT